MGLEYRQIPLCGVGWDSRNINVVIKILIVFFENETNTAAYFTYIYDN